MLKTIACVLALSASLPAIAAESRMVRYDDLNLNSRAGTQRLERRIGAAARSVCSAQSTSVVSLGETMQTRACVARAKTSAREQIAVREADTSLGG